MTAWNAEGRFQGRTDVPLSPAGIDAAERTAAALAHEPIAQIYSSDLRRARATAEAIAARTGAPVTTDPRLREFDFGAWEGLTWPQIVAAHPELEAAEVSAARRYAPPGGERFEDVRRRVRGFVDDRLSGASGETLAIVTHAGVLHALAHELGVADTAVNFRPASISRLTMEGGVARVTEWSDVRHLGSTGRS